MHSSLLYRSHRRHYNRLSPGPIYKYISCSIVFRIIIVFNCCRRYVVHFFQRPSLPSILYTTLFYKRGVCELLIFFYNFFFLLVIPHFAEVRLPTKQLKQFLTTRLHFIDVTLDFFFNLSYCY